MYLSPNYFMWIRREIKRLSTSPIYVRVCIYILCTGIYTYMYVSTLCEQWHRFRKFRRPFFTATIRRGKTITDSTRGQPWKQTVRKREVISHRYLGSQIRQNDGSSRACSFRNKSVQFATSMRFARTSYTGCVMDERSKSRSSWRLEIGVAVGGGLFCPRPLNRNNRLAIGVRFFPAM